MTKIAILTSGILPVPAVQGGAVETLVDHYLQYNDKHRLADITVYSVYHPAVKHHQALQSDVNHYHYIHTTSPVARLRKWLHGITHKNTYYHNSIDYYFHRALRHIRKSRFDLIVIENRPGYAPPLRQVTSAPIACHLHNDFLNQQTKDSTAIYNALTTVITVSDHIKARVTTINPHDNKTRTVHNGIDLAPFNPPLTLSRQALGFSNDDFILAYSGRLIPEKGILELIEAMDNLQHYPRIKLLVMGSTAYDNNPADNPFTQQLKAKARKLGERIKFTGYVGHDTIPQYLKLTDVAVIPSTWEEPFGLTVVEGMAAGLPIITTSRGGIPEIVTPQNATIISCTGNLAADLAEAILDLYQHPGKRQTMAEASAERSRLFDKDTYAENFFKALPFPQP
jgi:glycosyltransferase involved in cell wall biosynthesis